MARSSIGKQVAPGKYLPSQPPINDGSYTVDVISDQFNKPIVEADLGPVYNPTTGLFSPRSGSKSTQSVQQTTSVNPYKSSFGISALGGSRYTQQNPSDESDFAGNPLKKKKDDLGVVDITSDVVPEQQIDGLSDQRLAEQKDAAAKKAVQEELTQINRTGQLFDRQQEDLLKNKDRTLEQGQIDYERTKEDRKFQLENYRTNIVRQQEDVMKQRDQTMQTIRRQGAALGLNVVSTYYDNYANTLSKFNNVVNRLGEDFNTAEGRSTLENQRLDKDFERAKKQLLADFETSSQRLNEDFKFATRNYQDQMILDANMLVEKYGLSSEKLGKKIQELSREAVDKVNSVYFNYMDRMDKVAENMEKRAEGVINVRNKYFEQEKMYADDFFEGSANATIQDLNALVRDGQISEGTAQKLLARVVQSSIDTIDNYTADGVGVQFQDEIVAGINEGKTPNQVISEILQSDEIGDIIDTQQLRGYDPYKARQAEQDLLSGALDIKGKEIDNRTANVDLLNKVSEVGGIEGIIAYSEAKRGKTNLQCGELVNDYWQKLTGKRAGVGDTFDSKVNAIQTAGESETPVIGGMFAYNTGNNVGHIGIVTNVFADGSIEVLEANRGGGDGSPADIGTYSAGEVGKMRFSEAPVGGTTSELKKVAEYLIDTQPRGQGFSDEDAQAFTDAVNKYAQQGNEDMVYQLFRNKILENKNVGPAIYDNQQLKVGLETVRNTLEEFKRTGGDTNVFRAMAEKAANYAGTTTNEQLAKVKNQLGVLVADYIRAISGTAASDREVERLVNNMPNIKNVDSFNTAILDNLTVIADNKMKSNLEIYLGFNKDLAPKIFPEIYGDSRKPTTENTPQKNNSNISKIEAFDTDFSLSQSSLFKLKQ